MNLAPEHFEGLCETLSRRQHMVRAVGYLLKDADLAELVLAITAVTRGEMYLSPPISQHLIREYVPRVGEETGLEQLPPRQRAILQLIAEGHTTKAIAQRLGLSVKPVETHRSQMMERLDIHDIAGLVRYVIRMGVGLPDP